MEKPSQSPIILKCDKNDHLITRLFSPDFKCWPFINTILLSKYGLPVFKQMPIKKNKN